MLLDELTGLGFDNVHLLGRGVDTALYHPHRRGNLLRQRWGCAPAGPVVLCLGRLASEKSLELALREIEGIAASNPEARLVMVGDDPADGIRVRTEDTDAFVDAAVTAVGDPARLDALSKGARAAATHELGAGHPRPGGALPGRHSPQEEA
jgi:hypothetical protein